MKQRPSQPRRSDVSGDLVRLYLVEPMDIDPVPDGAFFKGRFAKLLNGVGAQGRAMVRARMITIIAETKFKTTDGLPISLVGLHGKDEVLALGPTWALERIAAGESPRGDNKVTNALSIVAEEIDALKKCGAHVHAVLRGDESAESAEFVQSFFRCQRDEVANYFQDVRVEAFIAESLAEAEALQQSLHLIRGEGPGYYRWWWPWEQEDDTQLCFVPSGRHVTGYPVSPKNRLREARPFSARAAS